MYARNSGAFFIEMHMRVVLLHRFGHVSRQRTPDHDIRLGPPNEIGKRVDFETALYVRQYREEQGTFRALSVVTKAIAAYMRVLVDPLHGWLELGGRSIDAAIRTHAAGNTTRTDCGVIARCVSKLLEDGHLVRCRIVGDEVAVFTTHDARNIVLSNWVDDPKGDWVVIANWVPEQAGLNREDTRAWHSMRREYIARQEHQQFLPHRSDADELN